MLYLSSRAIEAHDDGQVDITDAIFSLGCLFLGSGCPPFPHPTFVEDPTGDALDCDRGLCFG